SRAPYEEHDIFGDGVNVAARLEALAEPGGICLSGTVRDHIGDRLPYTFEDLGEQSVKNIARPVRVHALRPEATAAVDTSAAVSIPQPAAAPRLSIVVLPFTNLSDDREQQYLADGITDDLTTRSVADRRHVRDLAKYRIHLPGQACASAGAFELRAREETRESRGMPCLFLNTERVLGGKPPKKSGFRRHLAGSKMPKETFFTAISRWRVVSRRGLDASGFWQG